jgi:hypothetical protein
MASENTQHSRLSTLVRKNGENGHATLSNRLSRAEYEELRGNGKGDKGSDKISEPFEGNSGICRDESLEKKL